VNITLNLVRDANEAREARLVRRGLLVVSLLLFAVGFWLLWWADPRIAAGVALVLWGNNITERLR
jgi:hypothetical protein